ncbi:hypothetical protein [Streptomyces sp. NPDC001970]
MAILTKDFPGSEIAVEMQLKHVATRTLANRSTQGYLEKESSWAQEHDDAVSERRFERLKEPFDRDSQGENAGFGPGAERMREAFRAVRHRAEELRITGQAQRGDIRVQYDLLRRSKSTTRFGKLNHCTMDDDTRSAPSASRTPSSPRATEVRCRTAAAPHAAATASSPQLTSRSGKPSTRP